MGDILGIGLGAAAQAGLGALNNILGAEAAAEARRENYRYNEMAANNADARTRRLYNDLYSPGAQLQQLEAAGLSPSLMYGGTGSSGTSGAQGQGTAGQATPYMPMSMIEGAQIARMTAETENIQADTAVKQEQAKEYKGENAMGAAKLAEIASQTGLNNASTAFQNIQNEIAGETKRFQIGIVEQQLNLITSEATAKYWEAANEELKYNFEKETYEIRVKTLQEQYTNLYWDTLLKQAQKELNEEQIKVLKEQEKWIKQQVSESIARINQGWAEIGLKQQGLKMEYGIAMSNLKFMIGKAKQEQKMFEANLKQNKYLGEKGITAGYWGMAAGTFNSIVNAASRFAGLYMFGGSKETTVPKEFGSPSPMQSGGF